MSESKHTAGPWKAVKSGADFWNIEADRASGYVGIGSVHPQYCGEEQIDDATCEANTRRIIACVNGCEGINPDAVSDLLPALKGLLASVCGLSERPQIVHINRAVKVIAKAEGK